MNAICADDPAFNDAVDAEATGCLRVDLLLGNVCIVRFVRGKVHGVILVIVHHNQVNRMIKFELELRFIFSIQAVILARWGEISPSVA